jgi:hypothetical protein
MDLDLQTLSKCSPTHSERQPAQNISKCLSCCRH